MSRHPTITDGDIAGHLPWITAVVTAADQHIDYLDERFRDVFGDPDVLLHAEAIGQPSEERTLGARIAWVLATGRPMHVHRCSVRRGGVPTRAGERFLDVWLEPVAGAGERPIAVIVFAVDVTHRVTVARRIRRRFDHHRRLIGTLGAIHWAADALGEHVWDVETRRPLPPMNGASHAAGLVPTDGMLLSSQFAGTGTDGWLAAVHERRPFASTRVAESPDGKHWWVRRAVPVLDEAGGIEQWLGIDLDVTEYMIALATSPVPGSALALEARIRNMRGFSHDVRNVLNAADGYAQLLQSDVKGALTERQAESLRRMRGLFRSALGLVTDLLDAERAENGELEINRVPTEIRALITECVADHQARAQLEGLGLHARPRRGPLWTSTDPARARQILDNLVSNALKYTDAGVVTLRAELRARRSNDRRRWVAISVSDTGRGIPEGSREAIFREFVRLEPGHVDGQGVGLAISRRLANLLGGDVTVESAIGGGSTFTLWLPYTTGAGAH
jgi:signal transduction histidine kinase